MRNGLIALCLTLAFFGCGGSEPDESKLFDLEETTGSPPVTTNADSAAAPAATSGSGEAIRVAFVTNNASDFWKIAEAGTKKAAAEFGCEVLFRIPARGSAQEQQQIVQDLLTQGVSGIAISPKDPANQIEMLNQAAAEVDLITQDSDAPESNRACYIGTNNFAAGQAAGDMIKQALPDGGKIVLFVGTLDAQNAKDRKAGIEDRIAGSNIEIVDTRTDETDKVRAIANVQDTLVVHPDVKGLVGLWSYNGPAILNGVQTAGKLGEVTIIAFDEDAETLQGIKDGHIFGTIVQQPFEFGYQSVRTLVSLAKDDASAVPADKQLFIPTLSVTRDKVDAFWTELKALTGTA